MLARREEWMKRGKCRGLDPDLFVPGRGQSPDPALAVCNGEFGDDDKVCPVKRECAAYRAEANCMGVWGGEFFTTRDWLSQERELAELAAELAPVIVLADMRPKIVTKAYPATERYIADVLTFVREA